MTKTKRIIRDRFDVYCGICTNLIISLWLRRDLNFENMKEYTCIYCEQNKEVLV